MKNITFEKKTKPLNYEIASHLSHIPHFHTHIELIYVLEGKAAAIADRKKTAIKKGDVFVAFPNQVHYYENSVSGKYLVFIFSPDLLFGLKELLFDNIPKNNVLNLLKNAECCDLLNKLSLSVEEFEQTFKVGIINQLFAEILPEITLKPRIKTNNTTLFEVLNYCSANFSADITLEDIADALHISKFHISHLINGKLGLSFNTYINSLRINAACELLNETDKRISEISEEVGFGSIRSFNRAFKEMMNLTPLEYRTPIG